MVRQKRRDHLQRSLTILCATTFSRVVASPVVNRERQKKRNTIIEIRRGIYDPNMPIVFIDENHLWQGFFAWIESNLVVNGLLKVEEFRRLTLVDSAEQACELLKRRLFG